MRYFLLTTVVLFAAFLNHQAQEKTDEEEKVIIESIVDDGDKKEKNVRVISGFDLDELQSLIDSLLKSVDWTTDGLSKMNIIQFPGTDGIEKLNWLELNNLGEIGDLPGLNDQMKWLKMNSQKKDKPFLGVILDTDLELDRGIHIMDIVEQSAAEEAGLKKDDVLLRLGGYEVNSLQDLVEALKERSIGDAVKITYFRDGSEAATTATLKSLIDSEYDMTTSFDMRMPECCKKDPNCKHDPNKTYKAFIHQERPKLGVHIENLDEEMIADLKIAGGEGVLVTKVLDDSAAKKMGLKVNDVLIRLNEVKISDMDALHDILGEQKLGDEITIDYVRYGKLKSVEGVLFEFNHHSTIDKMIFFGGEEE